MLLLLRRFKYDVFMNKGFRRYLGYAVGELVLVTVGILIALQIDNWNEDRKERAMLQSYLESIATNIGEDLSELRPLRENRTEALYLISRFDQVRNRDRFRVGDVFLVNQIWSAAGTQAFLSANTSGFEALKSSGVLNRLQGSGFERLLARYYDNINQVHLLETALDDMVRPLLTELRQVQPAELESWAFLNPSALTPEQFEADQPYFAQLIKSPTMAALVDALFRNRALVLHYDSLEVLGEAFMEAAKTGRIDAAPDAVRTPMDDVRANLGFPDFIVDGRPEAENYFLTTTTPVGMQEFPLDSIRRGPDGLRVDWPGGADWAAVYWSLMSGNISNGRAMIDMSRFSKLVVELKGGRGDEVVQVHVKDADYPDDIAPISVDLTLTDDWHTYEIDLAEFAPNDFSRMHIPLGFLIFPAQEPLSFSIRNARYE